jgi:ubiquinone/menaquinone biosynthesis C-methylase UbiE
MTARRPDRRIAERILALSKPRAGGHCLDAPCGTGNYTSSLHALGLDVVGIDQSKTMLDAARAKYPAMPWQQAEVTALPFPDGHFDGIICRRSITFPISKPPCVNLPACWGAGGWWCSRRRERKCVAIG